MANLPIGRAVKVVLEGGPVEIPPDLRTRTALPDDRKIKIQHWGGYEHFEQVDEPGEATGSAPAVFRWTMRTEMAE